MQTGEGARKLLSTYFACINFSRMGCRSYGRGFLGPKGGTAASHIEFAVLFPRRQTVQTWLETSKAPHMTTNKGFYRIVAVFPM